MRFLHLADVHLDAPFAARSRALRERLREASREALRRAVDLALDEEVHAVLIAGDLFDGERLSFETERLLTGEFERLREGGVTVVYATGNHDPGGAGLRAHRIAWPDNVVALLDGEPRRTVITDARGNVVGAVTGAGHATAAETRDLSRDFPEPERSAAEGPSSGKHAPEVALLHTQVRSSRNADAHDPYAPSELERLRRAGYHYWALGHVHLRQELSADPPIHYPGSLQGRTLAETGPRGGLLVDLSEPERPKVEFREVAPTRFEELTVEGLESAGDLGALVERVAAAWSARGDDAPAPVDWLVRVRLSGPSPLWRQLEAPENLATLARELGDRLDVLDVRVEARAVHPVLSPDEYRGRPDVLGEALGLLERVRSGEATLDGVDPADLAGFAGGGDQELAAYVRERLGGAEAELLSRMVRPEPGRNA